MAIEHADLQSIHKAAFVGSVDPSADAANKVTAGKLWIDTQTVPPTLKMRNTANDAWTLIGAGGAGGAGSILAGVSVNSATPIDTLLVQPDGGLQVVSNIGVITLPELIIQTADGIGYSSEVTKIIVGNGDLSETQPGTVRLLTAADAAGGGGTLTLEDVDDRVAALIVDSATVTKVYDDAAGTLSFNAGGAGGLTLEEVDDRVASLIVNSATVTKVYDDAAGTLSFTASGSGGGASSGGVVVYNPADVPPAVAHAEDDEFSGAALSALWTLDSAPTDNADALLGTRRGLESHLMIRKTNAAGAAAYHRIRKAIAVASAATDFSYTVGLFHPHRSPFEHASIWLQDEADANHLWMLMERGNGEAYATVHRKQAGVDTFNVVKDTSVPYTATIQHSRWYMHLQHKSGVWSAHISRQGGLWFPFNGAAGGVFAMDAFIPTQLKLVTQFGGDAQAGEVIAYDWIRRDWLFL